MSGAEGEMLPREAIAVAQGGQVRLIAADDGRTIWQRDLALTPGASACAGQPVSIAILDRVVIAASIGHVFALALDDGSVAWHVDARARGEGETSLATCVNSDEFVATLGFVPRQRRR